MTRLLATVVRGAVGGLIATIPMTAVMVLGQRATGYGHLPPEAIVKNALAGEGTAAAGDLDDFDDLDDDEPIEFTWQAAHLAAGAGLGALYAVVFRRLTGVLPPPLSGALFGLGVWLISYQAILPTLELLPPASEDDADRQRTNVAAHLVFGLTLGVLLPGRRHARDTRPIMAA